jgi:hypothetical protein
MRFLIESTSELHSAEKTSREKHAKSDDHQAAEHKHDFSNYDPDADKHIENRRVCVRGVKRTAIGALHEAGSIGRGLEDSAATGASRLGHAHGTRAS